jgi:ABC-type Fe3+ transport system permease subunit
MAWTALKIRSDLMCLFPIFLSVKAAQAATAISIAVGVPLAHLPARTDFPGN